MTISSTTNRAEFTGNGTSTDFSFPYPVLAAADLKVYQNGTLKTLTTHYTLSGSAPYTSGTDVEFVTAPANGDEIVILRDPAITQLVEHVENDPLPVKSGVERPFDKLTMIAQRLSERVDRSFHLADSDVSGASTEIPSPEANAFLVWDEDGLALINVNAADVVTIAATENKIVDSYEAGSDFTAGTTDTLVLSQVPGAEENVLITFDGVVQHHSTFGVSGTTVVFGTPIPVGTLEVEAQYTLTLAVGITASENVTHSAAGSGAVTTNVRNKLREIVSVKDFGAVGDGVTNDASAFAAALTAASGGVLTIPPGTYKVNSALTVPADTSVRGYGATLDFSGAGNITALTLGSNVKLAGFKLLGPGNGAYNITGIGIYCFGTDNAPAAPTYVTGPTIIDVEVTEFANYGVHLGFVNYVRVSRCRITECGYAGIGGLSCNRVLIEGSYIGQIGPGTSGNAYGMFIDRSNGTLIAYPRSNYVRIVGSHVDDISLWHGIDTHAGNQFYIGGNIVNNCKRCIVATDSVVSGVNSLGPKNVAIVGNVLSALATGNAIAVNGAGTAGAIVDYAENVSVIGNTIESGGVTADDVEGCMKIYGTRNLTVSGNTLRRPIVYGIHLAFDNLSFNVNGNTIVDPNDTTRTCACITVTGINNKGYIGGNTFVAENTGLATKVAERSVFNGGGAGNDVRCKAGDNVYIGKAAGRLDLSSFARAYTAADTTPSVANTDFLVVGNAGAVTITNLDDGVEGQEVTLWFNDANTTVDRSNALLNGGVNFVSTAGDTLTLRKFGNLWYEVGRGVNG